MWFFVLLCQYNSFCGSGSDLHEPRDIYKNGAAFLSSDNKAQFLANEWMSAQKKIKSETNTISSNMGDKEGQYHRVQKLVNPPLIKTGTIKEEYRDANGTIKIESEGMHAGGVFREEGYAVVNQDKGSSNKQILETRYGVTDSFDYIVAKSCSKNRHRMS